MSGTSFSFYLMQWSETTHKLKQKKFKAFGFHHGGRERSVLHRNTSPEVIIWNISRAFIRGRYPIHGLTLNLKAINRSDQTSVRCEHCGQMAVSCGRGGDGGLLSVDSQRGDCEAVVNGNDGSDLPLQRRCVYWLHKPNLCQFKVSLVNFKAF